MDLPRSAAPLPKMSGRTLKYGIFRACERVSPMDIYGKPWPLLTGTEQADVMAFDLIRSQEDSR